MATKVDPLEEVHELVARAYCRSLLDLEVSGNLVLLCDSLKTNSHANMTRQ
jgi:hypothetical protein